MNRQKCRFDGWEITCQFASEQCQISMAFSMTDRFSQSVCDKDSSRVGILPVEKRRSRTPGVSWPKLGITQSEAERERALAVVNPRK